MRIRAKELRQVRKRRADAYKARVRESGAKATKPRTSKKNEG